MLDEKPLPRKSGMIVAAPISAATTLTKNAERAGERTAPDPDPARAEEAASMRPGATPPRGVPPVGGNSRVRRGPLRGVHEICASPASGTGESGPAKTYPLM